MQGLGETYVHAGQYASAHKEFSKALEIDPNFSSAHNGLGRIHRAQERYEEAFSEFAKESELMGRKYSVDQTLEGSLTYAVMGNREEALKMLMSLECGELHQRYLIPTI